MVSGTVAILNPGIRVSSRTWTCHRALRTEAQWEVVRFFWIYLIMCIFFYHVWLRSILLGLDLVSNLDWTLFYLDLDDNQVSVCLRSYTLWMHFNSLSDIMPLCALGVTSHLSIASITLESCISQLFIDLGYSTQSLVVLLSYHKQPDGPSMHWRSLNRPLWLIYWGSTYIWCTVRVLHITNSQMFHSMH